MLYDIVIIGAGICGTMLARELSRYELKVAVLDKENDIANGATMANSAIVHAGYDPEDGTLKAELNVIGARKYPQLCEELNCHIKNTGAYVVACGAEKPGSMRWQIGLHAGIFRMSSCPVMKQELQRRSSVRMLQRLCHSRQCLSYIRGRLQLPVCRLL